MDPATLKSEFEGQLKDAETKIAAAEEQLKSSKSIKLN